MASVSFVPNLERQLQQKVALIRWTIMKHVNFPTHELKQRKKISLGFVVAQNIGNSQTLLCALEATMSNCLCFQIKRLVGSDI